MELKLALALKAGGHQATIPPDIAHVYGPHTTERRKDGLWWHMFHHDIPGGGQIFQHMKTVQVDHARQLLLAKRRFRLVRDGRVEREEIFPANERVYGKYEIRLMLAQAGFKEIEVFGGWQDHPEDFNDSHSVMVIHARK